MDICKAAENSIIKKYRRTIWRPFIKALQDYRLVQDGDRIAVCISGGKDSMLMAKCLQELKRYSRTRFDLIFLVMDPGYSGDNLRIIEQNSVLLQIPITIFKTDIFEAIEEAGAHACYLCARMRRGHLYKKARELGGNKIALAHHFDDVIETTLLSMFYGGEIKAMLPKLHSKNFPGMELIRPLYLMREASIIAWHKSLGLNFIRCACRKTEYFAADGCGDSKRQEIKELLKNLRQQNPNIEKNIFKSMENVNLDTVMGYKLKNQRHSFLDSY